MNAEIIAIGTELLLGDVLNTNTTFLAKQLAQIGIDVYHTRCVGDNINRLIKAFAEAQSSSDIIIATGGLGPTADDISREAAAQFFNRPLVKDDLIAAKIEDYFKKQGLKPSPNNLNQAFFPQGAIILENPLGTAPAFMIEEDNLIFFALPGVPHEMELIFIEKMLPILKSYSPAIIDSLLIKFFGIGESLAEHKLQQLMKNQTDPTLAFLAGRGEVYLRLTSKQANQELAQKNIQKMLKEVKKILGQYIYGFNNDTLESVLSSKLTQKQLTLSLAESCTGGLAGHRLTEISGASKFFLTSVVAYNNQIKEKVLNVSSQTLSNAGAVSEETVLEMAKGVRSLANSDLAASVSGIAGPSGGSADKPVGTVYFALCSSKHSLTEKQFFSTDRSTIKYRSVNFLFNMLRRYIDQYY